MGYFPAYICKNGHLLSATAAHCSDRYCSKCGMPVISRCPNCDTTIKGHRANEFGLYASYNVPAYCPSCGKPFPWTSTAIEATVRMLEESDLSFDERQQIVEILPDVLAETPKTKLASSRLQKVIATGAPFLAEGLRDFAVSFGCEAFKKFLGWS